MGSVITCVTEFHRGPKTARPSASTPPFSTGEHILLIIPHSSVSVASLGKARRDRVDAGNFLSELSEGETSPHRHLQIEGACYDVTVGGWQSPSVTSKHAPSSGCTCKLTMSFSAGLGFTTLDDTNRHGYRSERRSGASSTHEPVPSSPRRAPATVIQTILFHRPLSVLFCNVTFSIAVRFHRPHT